MSTRGEELASAVKRLAGEAGYAACGIARMRAFAEFERALEDRIRRFPDAADLYEPMRRRTDPGASKPWARSIIACVHRYGKYRIPDGLAGHIGRNYLFDRRAKACPDHAIPKRFKEGLKALGLRVARAGAPDRWAGAYAGVTRFGRNGFAYSPEHGSWINVETWVVDAEMPPDAPTLEVACPDGCRACMDACPTGAIEAPFVMRFDRCVAYLTYGVPGPVAPELWEKMGPWIYGCDACQTACPLNRGTWTDAEEPAWLLRIAPHLTPRALAAMDEETYRTIVHPHFWYIPVEDLGRWHRNARRVIGMMEPGREP